MKTHEEKLQELQAASAQMKRERERESSEAAQPSAEDRALALQMWNNFVSLYGAGDKAEDRLLYSFSRLLREHRARSVQPALKTPEELDRYLSENRTINSQWLIYQAGVNHGSLLAILPARVNRAPALRESLAELTAALLSVLDAVDYTSGNCRANESVGAVLERALIANARKAVTKARSLTT